MKVGDDSLTAVTMICGGEQLCNGNGRSLETKFTWLAATGFDIADPVKSFEFSSSGNGGSLTV